MNILGRVVRASRPLIGPVIAAVFFGAAPGASAQTARQAPSAATAPQQPTAAADARINTAGVTKRVNDELGANLNEMTTAWQHDLDRMQRELAQPRVRYSELNHFRDDLQRIRSEASDLAGKLQPRLDEDKAQLKVLGPAPAAGQPAEPEQVAVSRAELNYHSSLLAGAQAAINAANGRVDSLLNTVQDIRHKNFTSNLFAPIPGVYSAQTWSKLPERVPQAVQQLRDLVADW